MIVKIVWKEWKKFWGVQRFGYYLVFLFLCFMGLHIFKIYSVKAGDSFLPSAYQTLCRQAEEEEIEAAYRQIQEEYERIAVSDFSKGNLELYRTVLDEMENVLEYPAYLENVKNPKEGTLARLHASAYDRRRQERQRTAFEGLTSQDVTFMASRGIELYVKTDFGDVLFFFLALLLVSGLVLREYEENMMPLVSASYIGNRGLICCKYLTGILHIVLFQLLMQIGKLFLYTNAYHFEAWGGRLQGVNGFAQNAFDGTIGEFLVIFTAVKILAGLFLFSLLFFLCAYVSSTIKGLVMVGIVCGFFLWCITGIEENSWLNWLRQLSPFQILCTMELMAGNQYFNLFGIPVVFSEFWIVLSIVLSACFFVGAILFFQKEQGKIMQKFSNFCHLRWQIFQKMIGKLKLWADKKTLRLKTLFYCIWKRSFVEERGMILFFLTGIFLLSSYQQIEPAFENENQYYRFRYIQEFRGDYTEKKSRQIAAERKRLEKIQQDMEQGAENYSVPAMKLLRQEYKKYPGLKKVEKYADYLREIKNGAILYEPAYKILLGINVKKGYLTECNFLALFLMVLIAVPLWGREKWSGMEMLIGSSFTGKRRYYKKQGAVLVWYAALIFFLVYVPWIYNVVSGYGISEWSKSCRSLRIFEKFPDNITLGEICIVYYFLHFIYLLFVGWIAGIIQKRVSGQAVATILSFAAGAFVWLWIQ